jgi:ABC-type multidrug transport system fused ATPase/permease subunit
MKDSLTSQVIVSLFRALYLAPTPCRSLLLKSATFLSLSIYLTVDVPRQLYPMIWLQVPSGPRLSSLAIVQLVASSACSVLVPILSPNSNTSDKGAYHPADRCSPLSRWWLYTWVSPFVTLGYQRNGSINQEDLYPLRNEASVETWQQAYASCCPECLPFKVILWKLFRMRLATMALFAGLCGFFELLGTVGLHQLLLFLQNPSEAKLQPWFCISLFALSPIIRGICMQTFEYFATHTIGDLKSLIVAAVYQKMTMLETDADINVGQLQSIISVDIDRLGTLRYTAMTAFMVPVEFITASIVLYRVMGWYYIPSLLFLLITRYPLSRFIISEQTKAQSAIVRATDSRITRTSESIRALLMIKILGNAQSFIRRILDERKQELDAIWLKMRVIILSESLSSSCSFLAMVLSLCLFIFAGKKALAPDIVFTLVAVFNIIKSMLTLSVLGAGQYAQAMVSLQRLSDFMDQKASPVVTDKTQPTIQPQTLDLRTSSFSTAPALDYTQGSLDVEFVRGGLNVITGDTGYSVPYLPLLLFERLTYICKLGREKPCSCTHCCLVVLGTKAAEGSAKDHSSRLPTHHKSLGFFEAVSRTTLYSGLHTTKSAMRESLETARWRKILQLSRTATSKR